MLATQHCNSRRQLAPETIRVQELVQSNLGLAHSIALRVFRNINRTMELEELISLGTEGLIQAAMRYDASSGSAFSTYAYYRIRGAIYDGIGDIAPLPRWMYRRVRAAKTIDGYLEHTEEDRPDNTASQIQALHNLFGRLRSTASLFVTSLNGYEDNGKQAVDESKSPPAQLSAAETAKLVRAALSRLPARERKLLRYHYFEDMSLQDAGRKIGISRSWASRLHSRAIGNLRRQLLQLRGDLV